MPRGAIKSDYNHSGAAVALEVTKGKVLKGTINSKLKLLPDAYEKKINLLFAKEMKITSMGLEKEEAKKGGDKGDNENAGGKKDVDGKKDNGKKKS